MHTIALPNGPYRDAAIPLDPVTVAHTSSRITERMRSVNGSRDLPSLLSSVRENLANPSALRQQIPIFLDHLVEYAGIGCLGNKIERDRVTAGSIDYGVCLDLPEWSTLRGVSMKFHFSVKDIPDPRALYLEIICQGKEENSLFKETKKLHEILQSFNELTGYGIFELYEEIPSICPSRIPTLSFIIYCFGKGHFRMNPVVEQHRWTVIPDPSQDPNYRLLVRQFEELDTNRLHFLLSQASPIISNVEPASNNHSAKYVIKHKGKMYKIDSNFERAERERKVLTWYLGVPRLFPSPTCRCLYKLPGSVKHDRDSTQYAAWSMNDVAEGENGTKKTGIIDNNWRHIMCAVAQFHHYATEQYPLDELALPVGHQYDIDYITGILEIYDLLEMPIDDETKAKLELLKDPLLRILDFERERANTVINGDLKVPRHIVNGYIVDFGSVCLSRDERELARGFITGDLKKQRWREVTRDYLAAQASLRLPHRAARSGHYSGLDDYLIFVAKKELDPMIQRISVFTVAEYLRIAKSMIKRIPELEPEKLISTVKGLVDCAHSMYMQHQDSLSLFG